MSSDERTGDDAEIPEDFPKIEDDDEFDTILRSEIPPNDDKEEKPDSELADDDRRECQFMRLIMDNYFQAKKDDPTTDMHHLAMIIYVNQVGELDCVTQQVFVDFNVAYYWRDPGNVGNLFLEYNVNDIWKPDMEIINNVELQEQTTDGSNFWINLNWSPFGIMTHYQRYKGTISVPLDLHAFPFDCQEINIQFKSLGSAEADFVILNSTAPENLERMSKGIKLFEWTLMDNISVHEDRYFHNHEERYYSELDVTLPVQRKANYYVTKIAAIIIMLVVMSWVVYFMPPDSLGDRTSVLFTLFLAAVAFQFVVGSSIPRTSYFTLLDKFMLLAYSFLGIPVAESVVVQQLATRGFSNAADVVDIVVLVASGVIYLLSCGVFGLFARRTVLVSKHPKKQETSTV